MRMMAGQHHYVPSVEFTSDDVETQEDRGMGTRVDGDMLAFTRAVGQAVRAARQSLGWRLADLGQRVGLSPSQLSRLEMGSRPIDMGRLFRLCNALGMEPRQVIAWAQREAFPVGHDAWAGTGQTWPATEVTTPRTRSRAGAGESWPGT
jgi:transcriptional regulator with XRE-family HTH domain